MPDGQRLKRCQPWLGTLVEMSCLAEPGLSRDIFQAPFAMVAKVHHLMSLQQGDSELARLNRAPLGAWLEVSEETGEVLEFAKSLALESGLAFNPTFRNGADPSSAYQIERRASGARARRMQSCVIDLSGVAKGYAVDRAMQLLVQAGPAEVLVNAGGDMRHAGRSPQRIALRDAANPCRHAGIVTLCGQALASSTSRVLDGDGPCDEAGVVDGAGRTLPIGRAASVLAASAMLADALAKVVLVDGARAEPLLLRHGAQRVLLPGMNPMAQAAPSLERAVA
jgi:thiamine biosynthesis lipoprotein